MKWIAAAALFALITPVAFADPSAPPSDQTVIAALYSRLSNTFTGGSLRVGHDRDFLVLGSPGVILNTSGTAQAEKLVDSVPQSWLMDFTKPGTASVTNEYKGILDNDCFCASDGTQPSEAETFKAKTEYYERRRGYYKSLIDYNQKTDAFMAAETELLATKNRIAGPLVDDWIGAEKSKPDDGNLADLASRNAAFGAEKDWWTTRSVENIEGSPATEFYPAPTDWPTADWVNISLDFNQDERKSPATRIIPEDLKLWHLGSANRDLSDIRHYTVTMDVMAVAVNRNDMNTSLFTARTWRWKNLVATPLSDGSDPRLGNKPNGVMPLLPMGLLLARNVVLTGDGQDMKVLAGANEPISWGPFTFQGNGVKADGNKGTLKISETNSTHPTIQVIGLFCEVLPKSPDPDSSLAWKPAL